MPMPLVSVIIPTYNSARYVTTAIDSVLAQTVDDFEVLVVDDGSTDNTRELLSHRGQSVRYLYQNNAGVSAARNHGIAQSRGRYIAFLDADDIWLPHKLERQLTALDTAPATQLCYSAHFVVDDALQALSVRRSGHGNSALEALLFRGNVVGSPSSVIVERGLMESEGFDTRLSHSADWDMWIRLARRASFLYVDEPLIKYRRHDTNMSRNIALMESDSLLVLHKGLNHPDTPARLRRRAARALGRNWMVLAGSYFRVGHRLGFARCALNALRHDPSQVAYLLAFPLRQYRRARGFA